MSTMRSRTRIREPGFSAGIKALKILVISLRGPVVEDPFEQVYIGLDGLRREEIMRNEGDALLQLVGDVSVVELGLAAGEILNNNLQIGEVFGERHVIVATRAAKLITTVSKQA